GWHLSGFLFDAEIVKKFLKIPRKEFEILLLSRNELQFQDPMKPIVMTSPPALDRPIRTQSEFPRSRDPGHLPGTRVETRWSPGALVRNVAVTAVVALWLLSVKVANAASAATREQRIQLHAGWNSIFLEVEPLAQKPAELFVGTPVEV